MLAERHPDPQATTYVSSGALGKPPLRAPYSHLLVHGRYVGDHNPCTTHNQKQAPAKGAGECLTSAAARGTCDGGQGCSQAALTAVTALSTGMVPSDSVLNGSNANIHRIQYQCGAQVYSRSATGELDLF